MTVEFESDNPLFKEKNGGLGPREKKGLKRFPSKKVVLLPTFETLVEPTGEVDLKEKVNQGFSTTRKKKDCRGGD